MKKNNYSYKKNIVTCACGKKYVIYSTKIYNVDVCSSCHPFYTGKDRILDVEGRVERFNKKYNK